jgi:hypothetical protein
MRRNGTRRVTGVRPAPATMRTMTLTMKCGSIILALVLAGCGSDGDADNAAPAANAAPETTTSTTVADDMLDVTVTGKGPLPTFGEKTCAEAGEPCIMPTTGSQSWSGDLEGSVISATGGFADASGVRFVAARIDVFTGTVKGCGTGSFVVVSQEIVDATEGSGDGEVVAGFGTGDLAKLSGTFEGEGGVAGEGIEVTWRGTLKCNG